MYYTARFSQLTPYILPVGRSLSDDGGLTVDWSGSGFAMDVMAERVVIGLGPYASDNPSYLRVYIDGRPVSKHAVVTGAEKIVLEDFAPNEVFRRLEVILASGHGGRVTFSEIELYGEAVGVGGRPEERKLRIEYIGDSLTCGYGALGGPHHRTYYAYEEDVTAAYAHMTSETLGASGRYTCWSGQGIVKNCNGETGTPMPLFFRRTLKSGPEDYDHSSWTPDIVVITAGTNDNGGGVSKEDFETGCRAFHAQIREVYPDAHIIWDYGVCNTVYCDTLESMVSDLGDPKAHYLRAVTMDFKSEVGSNGHPNALYHRRFADQLAKYIKENVLDRE